MQKRIVLLSFITTILFTIAIACNISPLLRGPAPYPAGWQWSYFFVNTLNRIFLPLLLSVAISITYLVLAKKKDIHVVHLLLFVLLNFLFQLSIMYFSRSGILVLIHRIINPDINGYFTVFTHITNISYFLRHYNDSLISFAAHAKSHGPGAITIFWLMSQIIYFLSHWISFPPLPIPHHADVSMLWEGLTRNQQWTAVAAAGIIPFVSSLTLLPLFYTTRLLYGPKTALMTILFYSAIPNVLLFIPINDVLLPFFILSGFYFFIKGIHQSKIIYFFLSGFMISIALYMSFSILPVYLLFVVFFLLFEKNSIKKLHNIIIFGVGTLFMPLLLYIVYSYNPFQTFFTAVALLPKGRSYLTWVGYNLYDISIFSGIPLVALLLYGLSQQIVRIRKHQWKKINPLTIAFFVTLFLVNFSGSVRGEVGRIWIFFEPFIAIIAARIVTKNSFSKKQILMLFFLQVLQLLAMQEFWVMLW